MGYDHCKTAYNKLADAWNMFMDTGKLQKGILRPDSYTSWIRCDHQHIFGPQVDLSEQDLAQKQEHNRSLIYNSKPVMQRVDQILRHKIGTNYAIILTDADGLIMEVLYRGSSDEIPVGNRYHEMLACSNAINISSHERKIIEVYGYEHLYPKATAWNTVGDLIVNEDKSVAGSLGIVSGINQVSSLVPIVKIGTQLIQSGLLFEQTAVNKIGMLLEEIPSAVITVNNLGVILNVNREFLNLFNVPQEVLIGQNVRDYLIGNIDYEKLLSSNEELYTFDYVTIRGRRTGSYTIVKKSIIHDFFYHSLITLSFTRNRAKNIGTKLPDFNENLYHFDDLIGETPAIKSVKSVAQKAAYTLFNVLIEGESGTGKELLAQSIHTASRPDRPFIAINCGALTKELLQSELFGYEEGAFTGAQKGGKPGQFELADGGSLFLDEIGEMPLEMQVSLLRCLQEKTVTRVGGTRARKVDVRIIAATNRSLYEQVKKGNFREDLYYRLNVIEINMPALREHLADIPLLCKYILYDLGQKSKTQADIEISPLAMECLCNYDWPGNVRELKNILERALVYSDGRLITRECLPLLIRESSPQAAEPNGSLKESERMAIIEAISKYRGNISKSAAELGIARSTLYQKMQRLGISPNHIRRQSEQI